MHKLYDLRDNLCKELERYADIQTLDANTLNVIDTLAHACKNICKIIEDKEKDANYSGYSYPVNDRMPYFGARRRDSMGRYTGAMDNFHTTLQSLMDTAPNEHVRQKLAAVMNEV